MITAQDIKAAAKRMGADIVGIGSIDRWSTAPIQMDPKQIMPNAKSIICLGFRVMRGSLRGVEEGTYFSNYSAMGYGGITCVAVGEQKSKVSITVTDGVVTVVIAE